MLAELKIYCKNKVEVDEVDITLDKVKHNLTVTVNQVLGETKTTTSKEEFHTKETPWYGNDVKKIALQTIHLEYREKVKLNFPKLWTSQEWSTSRDKEAKKILLGKFSKEFEHVTSGTQKQNKLSRIKEKKYKNNFKR